MSSEQRFERDLPNLLADLVVGPIPDYRDDVLARTRRMRQRPAWTLPERWLPMAVVDRRRILSPNVPWRAVAVLSLIALLLVAALAVYVGSHQRHLPPPFGPAANGAIVYAKDGDIYAHDTPTSAPRLLLGGPAKDEGATFSRQGDRFMFFRVVRNTDQCDCEVWIANADGSGAHALAGGPYHNPTAWDWSPDGTKIVIGYELNGESVMAVIPTDGSTERKLKLGIQASGPQWRPLLGDQILFRGRPRGRPRRVLRGRSRRDSHGKARPAGRRDRQLRRLRTRVRLVTRWAADRVLRCRGVADVRSRTWPAHPHRGRGQ